MADASYQPLVYREQGGNKLVVQSGGAIEIAGTNFITTGAALVLTSGISKGNIYTTGRVTGQGYVDNVESVFTTSPSALTGYGISLVGASGLTTAVTHTIAPIAGTRKTLVVTASVTSASIAILTTGTWDGTNNTLTVATTSGATETIIDLIAVSTARWRLLHVNASSNYALSAV